MMPAIGSISHGTLNPLHLIPIFIVELRKYDEASLRGIEDDYQDLLIYIGERKDLPPVGTELSEDMHTCLNDLWDALDFVSPPGCSFRTLEGDGSEIGWWPDE